MRHSSVVLLGRSFFRALLWRSVSDPKGSSVEGEEGLGSLRRNRFAFILNKPLLSYRSHERDSVLLFHAKSPKIALGVRTCFFYSACGPRPNRSSRFSIPARSAPARRSSPQWN